MLIIQLIRVMHGDGGYSPYGYGGKGGNLTYANNSAYSGNGGDGRIFGGNSGVATYGTMGNGGNGYYPGYGSQNGREIRNNMLIGTAPLKDMTPNTSIVIIEYGNSPEDF